MWECGYEPPPGFTETLGVKSCGNGSLIGTLLDVVCFGFYNFSLLKLGHHVCTVGSRIFPRPSFPPVSLYVGLRTDPLFCL